MPSRVPPPPSTPDPLGFLRRLTPRDRLLMAWLAEHHLLSTSQIATALFHSLRTAQMRLTILHRLEVLARFAHGTATGAPATSYLYTLGRHGLALHPHAFHDPDRLGLRAPRSTLERTTRLAGARTLGHLLGVNQFFIDLHAHTRRHPDTRLVRWWSEQHATDAYAIAGIHPDGHGVWHAHGRTVGFFLEHDTGTENLARVTAKLRGYQRLAAFGPTHPVLFHLPARRRETNLHHALAEHQATVPVATAVHGDPPAGPVWKLAGTSGRYPLHELPHDPGPDLPTNPDRPWPPDIQHHA